MSSQQGRQVAAAQRRDDLEADERLVGALEVLDDFHAVSKRPAASERLGV